VTGAAACSVSYEDDYPTDLHASWCGWGCGVMVKEPDWVGKIWFFKKILIHFMCLELRILTILHAFEIKSLPY
jgi:hypothetical protein